MELPSMYTIGKGSFAIQFRIYFESVDTQEKYNNLNYQSSNLSWALILFEVEI